MKYTIRTVCLLLFLFCAAESSPAQDATVGLYVCAGSDGMRNIVNKPLPGQVCEPYHKGILQQSVMPTKNKTVPVKKESARRVKSVTADNKITAPAAPVPGNKTAVAAATAPVNRLFPPTANFSSNAAAPLYRLIGLSPPDSLPAPKQQTQQNHTTPVVQTPTAPSADKHNDTTAQIWVCPQGNGTPMIVESDKPLPQCQPLGKKGKPGTEITQPKPLPNRGKPLVGQATQVAGSGEIALTDSPPQDIYKCFNDDGIPNYVGANQRNQFRHCIFFSHSFAGAQQNFVLQAQQQQTLTALAAAGLQKKSGPGLQCIGAGTIIFNGEVRHFNCATRSFDYTPGTSGGNIRLGDEQASIAAHTLDYLNIRGSCGGTITSENGRVFHLEPTKDCPQAFVIQANRIRRQAEKLLNIVTTGAFRQRQRALSAQINQIAREIGIDPYLVHAIISAESAYKPQAVSRVGARGLMQLMPATARRFGVYNSFHTGDNIRGGATYLKWLLSYFNGDIILTIAGYNAGEGNVRRYGNKIPPFIETRAYVPKVMQYYRHYRNHPDEIGL